MDNQQSLTIPAGLHHFLEQASRWLKRPMNDVVYDAIVQYVATNTPQSLADRLKGSQQDLERYHEQDPDMNKAIEAFIQAELAGPDPLEGIPFKEEPPIQKEIRTLLHG